MLGMLALLVVFYLGWVLTGVAMAGTLYPPAFAALTRAHGAHESLPSASKAISPRASVISTLPFSS